MGPHAPRQAAESLLAALAFALAACAHRRVVRGIVHWRAAKLPKGPDGERAKEEIEGMLEELGAAERAELALQLLMHLRSLDEEIRARSVEGQSLPPLNLLIGVLTRSAMKTAQLIRTAHGMGMKVNESALIEKAIHSIGIATGKRIPAEHFARVIPHMISCLDEKQVGTSVVDKISALLHGAAHHARRTLAGSGE